MSRLLSCDKVIRALAPGLILAAAVLQPVAAWADVALDYLQRLGRTDLKDVSSVMALADWAERRGLVQQAAEQYRRTLSLDADHDGAYQRLNKIADTHRLPEDGRRQKQVLQELRVFNPRFQLHVAPHFLVIYDTERAWALNRAVLLEKTHDRFFMAFRSAGLRPMPLDQRLVCVLFKEHADFTRYSKTADQKSMGWSSGYYSGRTNRVAFFHDRSNPAFKEAMDHMAGLEERLKVQEKKVNDPVRKRNPTLNRADRIELDRIRRELRWYRNRVSQIAARTNAAKTTHEAVHQLAYNSGVQKLGVMQPFWLVEGLATNFEVDDPSRPFGPYYDNPSRRQALKAAANQRRLTPLAELVVMTRPGDTSKPDEVTRLYAQGWGLFQFLFKKRHNDLRTYLRALRQQPPGPRDPKLLRKDFERAFGAAATVQAQFRRYISQMK